MSHCLFLGQGMSVSNANGPPTRPAARLRATTLRRGRLAPCRAPYGGGRDMALRVRSRAEESQPLTLSERRHEDAESAVERAALVAGRIMFGGYFVYSGIRHFKDRK